MMFDLHSGTFSKKSTVLNGRRPFHKDWSLFNYDYDSEASWEAALEDDESIKSDDSDDCDSSQKGRQDDYEYDDFCVDENWDSDGELTAVGAISLAKNQRLPSKLKYEVEFTDDPAELEKYFTSTMIPDEEIAKFNLGSYFSL